MAEHTPIPWETDLYYCVGVVPTGRPGGEVIVQCLPTVPRLRYKTPNEANAELIVLAVNNHEALVEALYNLIGVASPFMTDAPQTLCIEQARAVLAQATDAPEAGEAT